MREIKFRAWHVWDDGETEMVYDIQYLRDFPGYLTPVYKVMQYTGLKDKNGKEIYEGDIVKGFSGNGVVEWFTNLNWDSGGSTHSGFWCKEWCEYKDEGALLYHDGFDNCEVIGNIYENPELVK